MTLRNPQKRTPADTASAIFAVLACLVMLSSVTFALFAAERPVSAEARPLYRAQEI